MKRVLHKVVKTEREKRDPAMVGEITDTSLTNRKIERDPAMVAYEVIPGYYIRW